MEIINHIIGVIVSISNNILYVLSLYFMFLSLFGIVRRKRENSSKEMKKFALVVAAHNEEGVVRGVVESLKSLNYPKELYDIFVIADNCTDKTAEIAERAGANVYKRFNKDKRGKGYALEWMFDKIYKMDKKYDAIAIFDADNLASKDFLIEMNKELVRGYKVVQGYLDSKNPYDSWITASYSLGFWCSNRMFQIGRAHV